MIIVWCISGVRCAAVRAALPQVSVVQVGPQPYTLTRIGHIPGGGRPLLREGGPISYQSRPSATFPKLSPQQRAARGVGLAGQAQTRMAGGGERNNRL